MATAFCSCIAWWPELLLRKRLSSMLNLTVLNSSELILTNIALPYPSTIAIPCNTIGTFGLPWHGIGGFQNSVGEMRSGVRSQGQKKLGGCIVVVALV